MIVVKCCNCNKLIGLKNDHRLEIVESHTYCDACLDIELGGSPASDQKLKERRTDPRYAIQLPVHLRVGTADDLQAAGRYTSSDISSGGLRVQGGGSLAEGTRVFLSIMPYDVLEAGVDAPPLTSWGTVLRADENSMAFRYDAG